MPLFICRWQNSDFSAASARSREEAIELLAEVGNAEICEVFAVDNFMVHFHVKAEADDFEEMFAGEVRSLRGANAPLAMRAHVPGFSAPYRRSTKTDPNDDDVPRRN